MDGDCLVETVNLYIFADKWLNDSFSQYVNTDMDRDGDIDFSDFAVIAGDWLKSFPF